MKLKKINAFFFLCFFLLLSSPSLIHNSNAIETIEYVTDFDAVIRLSDSSFPLTTYNIYGAGTPMFVGRQNYTEYELNRIFLNFDTTSFPADFTVTNLQLRLHIKYDFSVQDFYIGIYNSSFGAGLSSEDWDTYDLLFYNISTNDSNFINGSLLTMPLDTSYFERTTMYQFVIISNKDLLNSTWTNETSELVGFSANNYGVASCRPTLRVSYEPMEFELIAQSNLSMLVLCCAGLGMFFIGFGLIVYLNIKKSLSFLNFLFFLTCMIIGFSLMVGSGT